MLFYFYIILIVPTNPLKINIYLHSDYNILILQYIYNIFALIYNMYSINILQIMRSCGEGLVLSPDGKGCIDKNECLYFPCRNGGSCVNREPGYRCHCPEGFWGENCELVQEGRTLKLSMGALAAILVCLLIIMSEHIHRRVQRTLDFPRCTVINTVIPSPLSNIVLF